MEVFYLGEKIIQDVARRDFGSPKGYTTDALVQYNIPNDIVFVDERCDKPYERYAALHEAICCGRYKHLAPRVKNPLDQCGMIDLAIIEYMEASYREKYVRKRIEMYETLLDGDFTPKYTEQFQHSLAILKNKLKEMKEDG